MKFKLFYLAFILYLEFCFAYKLPENDFELVFPQRLHHSRSRRDLSTAYQIAPFSCGTPHVICDVPQEKGTSEDVDVKNQDGHENDVSYKLMFKDNEFILDLINNGKKELHKTLTSKIRDHHAKSIHLQTYDENQNPTHEKRELENCFYDGKIRGFENSHVFISTCHGLTGSLFDGEHQYDIEPQGDDGSHKMRCVDKEVKDTYEQLKRKSHEDTMQSEASEEEDIDKHNRNKRDIDNLREFELINVEKQYIPYLTTTQTRYVEILVSVDFELYKHYNNNSDVVLERVLNNLLQVDKSYQAINVRLVLVALEIHTNGNRFNGSTSGGAELGSYKNYINNVLKTQEQYKGLRIDNKMWLSIHGWSGGVVGMAYVGTLCGSASASVNRYSRTAISGSVVVIGHEFGHNMNFPHDGSECKCLTPRGCFMGGSKSGRPGFSDCNMNRLKAKAFTCLNDRPVAPMLSRCGDGIKAADEECDCGTPENCAKNNDHCCEPLQCKLKVHKQCSFINNPECCSEQCMFRKQGTMCREGNGNCDVPEYCPGDSAVCPKDVSMANGVACGDSLKMVFGTSHRYKTTTTQLSPSIVARYIKIVPKLWKKDGYACTRLEVLGCSTDQAEANCNSPLGLTDNSTIPDSALSAGSFRDDGHEVEKIRMGSGTSGGWCAKTKTHGSWVKIDFAERKRITAMQVAGRYWDWITGYHLFYSDDNVIWHGYKESGAAHWKESDSMCYEGTCIKTHQHQCQELWNADADVADQACYTELNTNLNGFGTCNPTANVSCSQSNVLCGQLQCEAKQSNPYYFNYGKVYEQFTVNGHQCSGASITESEQAGLGMVDQGSKCGDGKMCFNQECKTPTEHQFASCKVVDGKQCDGKGTCTSDGICLCEGYLNPKDDCKTALPKTDGGWSVWSSYTKCTAGCGGGKQSRYRFCNQPYPKNGGLDCVGEQTEEQDCNTDVCPVGRSCKAIKIILENENRPVYDGIYTINPKSGLTVQVYCDMTRNGGGWTLIVSSHTNSWTSSNVRLRNQATPDLMNDYSILKHADDIKKSYLIPGGSFQYRLEAEAFGRWGGVFEAPSTYLLDSNNKNQQDITIKEKFNDWEFNSNGIEKRLPYVYQQRLTTSGSPSSNTYGTITDNVNGYHPSKWIKGDHKMLSPEHVWYWIREGDYNYPRSCLDILFRGFNENQPYKSGVYKIEPTPNKIVQTYCDLERHGGGWTLLTKSSTTSGWSRDKVMEYNSDNPLANDYSIFGLVDTLKYNDVGEISYDYMIEADGENSNGGIFSFVTDVSSLTCPPSGIKPKLLKKFGSWDEKVENIANYPVYLTSRNGVYLTASDENTKDLSGRIVADSTSSKYMEALPNPSTISVWVREGGSRKSCNDLKIHGYHKGKRDYQNGFYMMSGFQPMYCDMTTTLNEGWTLLVTSASNKWTLNQVKSRNTKNPSLFKDYSILDQGDEIKTLSKKKIFKYMLEANERGRWGGIWQAPMEYSFVSTDKDRYNVKQLMQFDVWAYEVKWYENPRKRFPYLATADSHLSLLTTAYKSETSVWGTIIAGNTDDKYTPSAWITPQMKSPGVIWYWMNENDCDSDYKKIDGAYTPWSMWSQCSVFCGKGTMTRKRQCTSPKPRCGGDECDPNESVFETANCTGLCSVTKITDPDNKLCFEPKSGGCSVADNTQIALRSTSTHCQTDESDFLFDREKGEITHKCSGKQVCTLNGATGSGTAVIISSTCSPMTIDKRFVRTLWKSVQIGNRFLDPYGGSLKDGVDVKLWGSGMAEKRRFIFPSIVQGAVKASFFDSIDGSIDTLLTDSRFPNSPTATGRLDHLDRARDISSKFGYLLTSYFIAPQSGEYVFVSSCDNECKVYLSTDANAANKKEIIYQKDYSSYHQWTRRGDQQKSAPVILVAGQKYYIEGINYESGSSDHFSIGAYLPDGTALLPITSHYLSEHGN